MHSQQLNVSFVRLTMLGLVAAAGVAGMAAAQAPASDNQSRQNRRRGIHLRAARRCAQVSRKAALQAGEGFQSRRRWRGATRSDNLAAAPGPRPDRRRATARAGRGRRECMGRRTCGRRHACRCGRPCSLSFESARAGFLYVIDREQYADGSASEPYLIFPTSRTRGGDNRVEAGRLIEVPDQADRPNYFSVRRSRPDQVAETLNRHRRANGRSRGLHAGQRPAETSRGRRCAMGKRLGQRG